MTMYFDGIVVFVEPDTADNLLGDEADHVVRHAFTDKAKEVGVMGRGGKEGSGVAPG